MKKYIGKGLLIAFLGISLLTIKTNTYAASSVCTGNSDGEHHWNIVFTDNDYYDEDFNTQWREATPKSDTECILEEKCWDCGETRKTVQKHQFDKYNICTKCGYEKASVKKAKFGTTYHCNSKTMFRITVPKDGLLSSECSDFTLYNSSKKKLGVVYMNDGYSLGELVTKGTYYLRPDNVEGATDVNVGFQAASDKKNTTYKKAIDISGKTCTGVVYAKNTKSSWSRYYKIKVTGKNYLAIAFVSDASTIKIYDSHKKTISLNKSGFYLGDVRANYVTTKKLSKGTYYIKVESTKTYKKNLKKKSFAGDAYKIHWFLTDDKDVIECDD